MLPSPSNTRTYPDCSPVLPAGHSYERGSWWEVCWPLCGTERLLDLEREVLVEGNEERCLSKLSQLYCVCIKKKSQAEADCQTVSHTCCGSFDTVGVDVLQLPCTFDGNQYAVVFVNYLTKWLEGFAVLDQTTKTIARLFVKAWSRLLSDRGANFLSCLVLRVCELMGTSKINTSGYHPQCDGLVEKFNSTIMKTMEKHG